MSKRYELGKRGKHLWSAALGTQLREEMEAVLGSVPPGDSLVIGLGGVEAFNSSFANHFFGRAMLRLPTEFPGRFLILEGLTADTRSDLEDSLIGLGLMMVVREGGRLQLIGKLHPVDVESFDAVVDHGGPVTSSELKDRLGVNLTTMNERLGKLAGLGVLRREPTVSRAGREQYQYWPPK